MDSWRPTLNLVQKCSTCFGMLMNLVLLFLIFRRSPQNLGVYKYLMVYITLFELFFGALELLTIPDMWTKDSAFIVVVDPEKAYLPAWCLQVSVLIYCGSFAVSLAIFGIQFVYRYQVLSGNSDWTSSHPLNLLVWLGSPLIFAGIWVTSCAVFLGHNSFVDKVLKEFIIPKYAHQSMSVDRIGLVAILFYPQTGNGETGINWDSFIGMSFTTTVLLTSESIMIFFGVKCYLATKSLMSESVCSPEFRRLQWQLFYALVSQTVIPIVFMQLPVSMVYLSIFLNASTEFFGVLLAVTISFYLATDALPTIFIIKDFRKTVIDWVMCRKMSPKVSSIAPNNSRATVPVI